MSFRSGFVAILGRPNAGKSTLVNALVGRKVAIVSPRPQTTRNRIQGIVNQSEAQMVLIDTPGLHKVESALGRQMMDEVRQALEGVDVVALIVDASENRKAQIEKHHKGLTTESTGNRQRTQRQARSTESAALELEPGERYALAQLKTFRGPAFLLLNKIDVVPRARLLPLMDVYRKNHDFAEIFPISALTGDGLDELRAALIAQLPEGPPYFPPEQFTDQPERFLAAEIIREKLLQFTRKEVPHAVAVLVDHFAEAPTLVHIRATVYVEREGQKGIVIGKGGEMLKRVGTAARQELELLLGAKVFLELHVKVQRDWRENPALVRMLDWRRQLEELTRE